MTSNTNITVTGVDLGSSAAKIAAVLNGGVQIITNQATSRQTPHVVGFTENERLIGQLGQLKIKSNHSNTVFAPSRFLGFDKPCNYLSQELEFCPAKTQKLQSSTRGLTFNLMYGEKRQDFTTEQLVAAFITEIEKIISQTNNLVNKNLVIAVPSYFTQHERKALLDAVKICKKKVNNEYTTQLVNQQIAASIDYGYAKRHQYSEEPQGAKKVLFIDLGHSSCKLFVSAFNKQHFRILCSQFDRQIGCKFMDYELVKFYAQKFDSQHPNLNITLMESKRAFLKLIQAIQKQRKILSAIGQHELNIQSLLEDQDLCYLMKKQHFEQIIQPLLEKFRNMLNNFNEDLKMRGIKFDSIELVGGGTRIPCVLNIIRQIFGQQPSRTINSSQCIAKGAALISAMNSSIFRVQPYDYFMAYPYTIDIKVKGLKVEKTLINKNEFLLKEKSVEFQVDSSLDKFTLLVEYQEKNIQSGLQSKIFQCEVTLKQKYNKKPEETIEMKQQSEQAPRATKIILSVSIDQNGLILFDKITSPVCEVQVKKVNYFQKFTNQQISTMQQKEKQMTLKDLKIKKYYDKKNQYESLIYKNRDLLDSITSIDRQYVDNKKLDEIRQYFQEQNNWLSSEINFDSNLKIEEFDHRQKIMNQRVQEFRNSINLLKQSHHMVNAQLKKLADFLNEIISKRTRDMYPPNVDRTGEWINSIFQKQSNTPKCYSPVVSVQQIKQVHQNLINKINEFDQQLERQRQMNARRTRQQQRFGSSSTPYQGYGSYGDSYTRPRTKGGNKPGFLNNPDPFSSFFGKGGFF